MLRRGCSADTLYMLPPDHDYEDFEEFIEGALKAENQYTSWDALKPDDVDVWLDILSKS